MLSSQQILICNLLDLKHLVLALSLSDYSREAQLYSVKDYDWGVGIKTTITNREVFEGLDYIVSPYPTDSPVEHSQRK